MRIFISWSGQRSHALAHLLRKWIPPILNYATPWFSAADVTAGSRWNHVLADQLEQSRFGLICLTSDNVASPWLIFEAGCLAKSVRESRVVPILLDLEPSQIGGPLAQFQARKATKSGLLDVLVSVNQAAETPSRHVDVVFEGLWPGIERELAEIPHAETEQPSRSQDQLVEELVLTVRSLDARVRDIHGSVLAAEGRHRLARDSQDEVARGYGDETPTEPESSGEEVPSAVLGIRLVELMSQRMAALPRDTAFVVGFVGAAGLGKTTTAEHLVKSMPSGTACHVKLDGFLHDRASRNRAGVDGYQLEGWHHEEAESVLTQLVMARQSVVVPTYDPDGTVGPGIALEPAALIILDGNLVVLSDVLRGMLNDLVFFDAPLQVMRSLRSYRDTTIEQRFSPAEAERVWQAELANLRRNIMPAKASATIVVGVVNFNRFRSPPSFSPQAASQGRLPMRRV